jgi:Metallo-peptidase family M12/Secretion system C-terminal sorting domain/Reprolysin family propeptide
MRLKTNQQLIKPANMGKINLFLCLYTAILFSRPVFSQQHIVAGMVREAFAAERNTVTPVSLLSAVNEKDKRVADKYLPGASYFNSNKQAVLAVSAKKNPVLSLEISLAGKTYMLDMISADESFSGVQITTSSGRQFSMDQFAHQFYRGVVRGKEDSSIVSFSLFEGELSGIISLPEGNLVVGKLKKSDQYIVYNDKELPQLNQFSCHTNDGNGKAKGARLTNSTGIQMRRSVLSKCVRLYYETEYDIYFDLGSSVSSVISRITFLHNQVATLYLNEGIKTTLSHIKVWDRADSYTSSSTGGLLDQFQRQIQGNLNGDLGILLTYRDLGGGQAAGFDGLCNEADSNQVAVAMIDNSIPYVPVYSWAVYVVTHEFGHLFGSQHTHACVWGPNQDRPIDGCHGYQYYECEIDYIPPGGGTIMSYCHLQSVGVNFNLGFGPEPGALIYNSVNAATCLAGCCKTNVTITGIYTTPLVESSTWIASSGTTIIPAGASVTVDASPAAGYVLLNAGFETQAGAVFTAQAYNGCTAGIPAKVVPANIQLPVPENTISASVKLIPNPARELVYIHMEREERTVKYLIIMDISGRILLRKNDNTRSIDISRFNPGVYFYTIQTEVRIHSGKFIKQ